MGDLKRIPNGLCSIYGHDGQLSNGFIVGNLLFSAAHTLQYGFSGHVECLIDGHHVDISRRLGSIPNIHPKFTEPLSLHQKRLAALNGRSAKQINDLVIELQVAYDIGHVVVNDPLPSAFRLSASLSAKSLQAFLAASKSSPLPSLVRRNRPGAVSEVIKFNQQPVPLDFYPNAECTAIVRSNTDAPRISMHRSFNVWEDASVPIQPGNSGAPLVHPQKDHTHMVIGVCSRGPIPRPGGLYTSTSSIWNWFEGSRDDLFVGLAI